MLAGTGAGAKHGSMTQEWLRLRPMEAGDVETVRAIELEAHGPGWPGTNFARELTGNPVARYVVLERAGGELVGFAGFWIQLDEAHVVNVAVRPAERGKGYGMVLVHGLVDLARRYGMGVATLECRESNVTARNLYGQYGFYEVGLRKGYYTDNGEAAVIMTTEELDSEAYTARFERLAASLAERFPGVQPRLAEDALADLREPAG